MKTISDISARLNGQGTLASVAAAAVIDSMQLPWERELANGEAPEKILSDLDGVIQILQSAKQELGGLFFRSVPTPALKQLSPNIAGNDYAIDTKSGESGVWIEVGDKIVVHVSKTGSSVSVGLFPNHEDCIAADDPIESCVLSERTANAAIKQAIREREVSEGATCTR